MKQRNLPFSATSKEAKIDPVDLPDANSSDPLADPSILFRSPDDFAKCLEHSWRTVLATEFKKSYFPHLLEQLRHETREIFPPKCDILNAFNLCPFHHVKVVIIGQDPYHDDRQAHGLCFSVRHGIPIPKSLQNIYKELANEYPETFTIPKHGCLENWAKQGVLLLNASLTVAAHNANSHEKFGWTHFTSAALAAVNEKLSGVVFLAWGKPAQKVCSVINTTKHSLLKCGHPSPLSQKFFFGCGHFIEVNRILEKQGKPPINWNAINN
jgi:uracil-DNA glycosylase